MIPSDINDAARECVSALLNAGVHVEASDQSRAQEIIASALLREREALQAAVIEAVAGEPEPCRRKVFAALKRGAAQ